ncbi:hypothetical protein J2Z23_000347 [Lederbergia galactosidilyticus]|uniref:glycoside hydrolase family 43 protein n=1 Tax=Lederbergia galactosidilytica TaxID=217031 RepID=UPI001AE6637E|nr:glycoside hydrolase family 43 protein [Lederbergia galactosidilytica]MBP1913415.1 hypothetical protein [Lederbergia galactosidilytica]
MTNFLFAHFIGESRLGEQVYFSISKDGNHFYDLNAGNPILISNIGEKGARDPFLIRDPKTNKVYIIATDLQIHKGSGWQHAQEKGSRDIIIWETNDLLNWQGPRAVTVGVAGAGNVWAPEAVYDKKKEAFLVFWASKVEGKHKIYASYTKDFVSFDEPFIFVEKDRDVIDTTISYSDGNYYRLTKDETSSRIIMEYSDELVGEYKEIQSLILADLAGVEGPQMYQVADGTWYLIVDQFAKNLGYMILETSQLGKKDFVEKPKDEYDFGITKKRHGSVLAITKEEYEKLLAHYK